MHPRSRYAIASTLGISTLLSLWGTPALAEGTAQVGATQRLYEYGFTSSVLSTTDRPLNVDITVPGEVINVSVCATNLTDNIRVEIYDPVGTQVVNTTLTDGTFGNANCQHTFSAGTNLLSPLQHVTTTSGTYEIRLFNLRTNAGFNTDDDHVFRLFDVTVTPNAATPVTGTEIQGRLHSNSWAYRATTNDFSEAGSADTDYFVVVPGGRLGEDFVWFLDLNNFAGLTYEIIANNIGVDAPNSGFSTNFTGNSITPLYPIYLAYPEVADPLPITPPDFTNFRFIDSAGIDNTITPGDANTIQDTGTFEFSTDVDGTYSIVIDADDNGVFEPGADVYLFGTTAVGANSVVWDGRDNNGDPLPVGTYSVSAEVRVGEYHFVAGDAETSGGPSVPGLTIFQALSQSSLVDTRVFWDDATLLGATTTLPTGELSSSPAARHTWGNFTNNGFGNTRYIDTYVFGDRTLGSTPVIVAADDTPIERDYGDAPDTGPGGTDNTNYDTTEADVGPSHNITADLSIGTAPDADDGTQQNTAADDDDSSGSDEGDITLPPLANDATDYTINNIAVTNTTGNPTFMRGWIDFDQSGTFDDDELATATVAAGATTATLEWSGTATNPIPTDITTGTTYARFRLSSTDGLAPTGNAADGEVEDYQIVIAPPSGPTLACDTSAYAVIGSPSSFNVFNPTTLTFSPVVTPTSPNLSTPIRVNGLSFNPLDNYIYAFVNDANSQPGFTVRDFVRISADGTVENLGRPELAGSPGTLLSSGSVVNGVMDGSGNYYNLASDTTLRVLSIGDTPSTGTITYEERAISGLSSGTPNDLNFNPVDGFLYGIRAGVLYRIPPTGGAATAVTTTGATLPANAGGSWATSSGISYFYQNGGSGNALFAVDLTQSPATVSNVGPVIANGQFDAASCTPPAITKDVNVETTTSGSTVTYTYQIFNGFGTAITVDFDDILTDANITFDTGSLSNLSPGGGSVSTFTADQLSIDGISIPTGVGGFTNSVTFTADVDVDAGAPAGMIENQAQVTFGPDAFPSDDPDTGSIDDPTIFEVLDGTPEVLLTKRITAINRGLVDEQIFDNSFIDVGNSSDNDNEVNWLGNPVAENVGGGTGTVEEYIAGISGVDDLTAIDSVQVSPGEILEYTIPFLSNGNAAAENVYICDLIPTNTTFDTTAFNSSLPASAGPGARGIFVSFDGNDVALTNDADGDEIAATGGLDNGVGGYYIPPGVNPVVVGGVSINCGGSNDNGAVVVDLSDLPNATGEGTPSNSFGFVRFRVVVD